MGLRTFASPRHIHFPELHMNPCRRNPSAAFSPLPQPAIPTHAHLGPKLKSHYPKDSASSGVKKIYGANPESGRARARHLFSGEKHFPELHTNPTPTEPQVVQFSLPQRPTHTRGHRAPKPKPTLPETTRLRVSASRNSTGPQKNPVEARTPHSLVGSMSVGKLFKPSMAFCMAGRTTPSVSSIFLAPA